MSAEGSWNLACQWATQNTNEIVYGSTLPHSSFSIVTPAASGTFLTNFALGGNVLQYVEVAGSHPMRCCNTGQVVSFDSATMGFFWHPLLNPTGGVGTYDRLGIAAFDDGALGGWALTWRTDLKLEMWYTGAATAVTGGISTTTASTLETYETVLNPWYFIAMQVERPTQVVTIRIYKWGNTGSAFTLVDTITTKVTAGFNFADVRLGSDTLGIPTGSWQMGNLWTLNGSGIWGPVGCNMASGAADGTVNQQTNSTIWRHSDGVDYPAATTESADIDDYSDADYVQNKSTSSTSIQYHHMANSIVPGTPNILAVQAGFRAKVVANVDGADTARILLRKSTTIVANRYKDATGTGYIGAVNTFWHNWVCNSTGGSAAWVYTDIDAITCGFSGRDAGAASQDLRLTSLYITVAYGTDGAAPDTTTREQTQVV